MADNGKYLTSKQIGILISFKPENLITFAFALRHKKIFFLSVEFILWNGNELGVITDFDSIWLSAGAKCRELEECCGWLNIIVGMFDENETSHPEDQIPRR